MPPEEAATNPLGEAPAAELPAQEPPAQKPPAQEASVKGRTTTVERLAALEPLQAPVLVALDREWAFGAEEVVAWNAVPDAARYRLQVSRHAEFADLLAEVVVERPEGRPGAEQLRERLDWPGLDPIAGDMLHVRVRAERDHEPRVSSWSALETVVALARPRLVEPATSLEVVREEQPTFRWDPVPGASAYRVVVSNESGDAKPVFNTEIHAPEFASPTPLLVPGLYKVRVRGLQGDVESDWSETRTFKFDPHRPLILSPADGEEVASTRPRLEWISAGDARHGRDAVVNAEPGAGEEPEAFEVELCRIDGDAQADDGAPDACASAPTSRTEARVFRPSRDLARDAHYRLRVRRWGKPYWSEPVVFRIGAERQEVYRVRALADDPRLNEMQCTTSPDGRYLAVASQPARADEGSSAWRLSLYDRRPGEATFKTLPGAGFVARDSGGMVLWSLDLAWSMDRAVVPVLLVASSTLDADGRSGGGLHRFEGWTARLTDLLPSEVRLPVLTLSAPVVADEPRIYYQIPTMSGPLPALLTDGSSRPSDHASLGGEIWSVRTDGSDRRLHSTGQEPAISPDGRTLAFVSNEAGQPRIRLLSIESGEVRDLPVGSQAIEGVKAPAWSPDGALLAFARDDGVGFDIVVVAVETGDETVVTRSYYDDINPVFLPSSSLERGFEGILFSSNRRRNSWDLFVIDYEPATP